MIFVITVIVDSGFHDDDDNGFLPADTSITALLIRQWWQSSISPCTATKYDHSATATRFVHESQISDTMHHCGHFFAYYAMV